MLLHLIVRHYEQLKKQNKQTKQKGEIMPSEYCKNFNPLRQVTEPFSQLKQRTSLPCADNSFGKVVNEYKKQMPLFAFLG